MIILDLSCDRDHRFEGWFASSEAFREQRARKLVSCPHCDSPVIRQLPSAPYVRSAGGHEAPVKETPALPVASPETNAFSDNARRLFKMLSVMAKQAENVGERFPEEARRMHYDETPARNIRGTASAEETLELLEEGIMVMPVPVPPENETH